MLDRSQRWAFPGLHYFEDDPVDRALFFGREKEILQLTERIIAEDLTVLFGKSGDGKTSLINAGLKWAFRQLGYLPVRARIFNLPEQTPLAVLYQAIAGEAKLNDVTLPPDWQRETLWESFSALRPIEENGLKPIVLILDQFEELFTLMAGRGQEQEDFIAQFADLVRGRLPETVREKYRRQLASLPATSDEARKLEQLLYGSTSPTVRILLSLREDYLAFLNNLGRRIAKVFTSRYRLSSLTIEQARLAIANPPQQDVLGGQKFRIEDDAVAALLNFLTQQSSRSGVSEEIIGPPQLQVLCRQLEEQMREKGKSSISVSDLGGDEGMRNLLSRYYRDILEKFPAMRLGPGPRHVPGILGSLRRLQPLHSPRFAVRRLCEERLITAGGNRNSRHEDEIIREIGVAPADLQELVESRLLRREPRMQESFYELSHDSLVPSLQLAGGMRQTWVMGLKVAMIAAIVLVIVQWGWPYARSKFEMSRLEAEFAEVKKGEATVRYFRESLKQARNIVTNMEPLLDLQNSFDDWRKQSLRDSFLQANLPQADSLLKVLDEEYPREKDLLAALSDTLRERGIRQVQLTYASLVEDSTTVTLQDRFAKADSLLGSASTNYNRDIRIIKLQENLASQRGDWEAKRQYAHEIDLKKEVTRIDLQNAIQIAEPRNMTMKGDSSGKASSAKIVLQNNPLFANTTVLLNGQPMPRGGMSSDKENMLPTSIRPKVMPARTTESFTGMVPIPAGAHEVQVKITVRNSDGVEASRDFVFTVDHQPPHVRAVKISYRNDEKEAWKEMPKAEWRGNFWRIEMEAS